MPIYELNQNSMNAIEPTTFAQVGISERNDLQRLLRDQIEIISPDTLVIAEEFSDWEDSRRRIDLLGIDRDANLVVIELKRTDDGGHMELQSLRYAAMVSTMTFANAVVVFERYLKARNDTRDAEQVILGFLQWDEPQEDDFAAETRIVLASAEFSKELTTSVLWLANQGIDIRCVRIKPYGDRDNLLVDVQQVIPLSEAEDYQVRVREKRQQERTAKQTREHARYDVEVDGSTLPSLAKRRAIHAIVFALCKSGRSPDEISEAIDCTKSLFQSADGVLKSEGFVQALAHSGTRFDPIRWFYSDDELIYFNGKTFAFTNQWGTNTESAMQKLIEHFNPQNIAFERVK